MDYRTILDSESFAAALLNEVMNIHIHTSAPTWITDLHVWGRKRERERERKKELFSELKRFAMFITVVTITDFPNAH